MSVFYISPSVIPSRSANTVHVVSMCKALNKIGLPVTLYIKSNAKDNIKYLSENYGLENKILTVISYKSFFKRGTEFFTALKAIFKYLDLTKKEKESCVIISRNIYGAILFSVFLGKKIIYETHAPETGFRKRLQSLLIKCKHTKTVVISNALKNILLDYHNTKSHISVLHDAAFDDSVPLTAEDKRQQRSKLFSSLNDKLSHKRVVGYFGHLYQGRGIEVIQELAKLNNTILFLVFGGNENEIAHYRKVNKLPNLLFMGHLPAKNIKTAMSLMDVLLMPYQKSVSVGLRDIDTSQWMSPMKMFEYMSVGVPIVSSNLPVLREVLVDKKNSLLVEPDNVMEWSNALNLLLNDTRLALKISETAYSEFQKYYTWDKRVKNMLDLLQN